MRIAAASSIPLPSAGDNETQLMRSLIDAAFFESDADATGEIEIDELHEDLAVGILSKFVRRSRHQLENILNV